MRIKGVGRQPEGGGYYRIRQPLDELGKHGHETSCTLAKSDVTADGADIVVGQFIGGQGVVTGASGRAVDRVVLVHHWWRELARDSKLVYELDDDPFEMEPDNPVYRHYMNPVSHDSISFCLQVADLVTVSTPVLADRIRTINPNVVVLQNRIDESVLTMTRPRRGRLVIGWAGGASHYNDIASAAYGLRKTIDHHKDVDVHFIGADFRHLIRRPVRLTPWALKTVDYYKLIDFDIGIAPLVPTVFAETKSHIKALEYSALGIPVIASDVAPYRDFVVDGVTGFLVRRDHEWAARLRELVNDEAMRTEMGAKARELASQWTIQTGWKEWESAYSSVL